MTISSKPQTPYEHALALAEAGRHEEALAAIRDHLLRHPRDGQALNDAGALLFALRRFEEAIDHLRAALQNLPGEPAETLWNLAEASLAAGRPADAADLFDRLHALQLMSPDLINRTATAFLETGRSGDAVEVLLRSLELAPAQQKVLGPILDQIRRTRPKVALLAPPELARFSEPIRRFLESRLPCRVYHGDVKDEVIDRLQWCRIAWLEGCSELTYRITNMTKRFRIVCRLHEADAFSPWLNRVMWENVDVLLFGGTPAGKELLRQRVPLLEERTRLADLPLGVDVSAFPFGNRQPGKNLALLGNLDLAANAVLLLQCLAALRRIDPGYTLFVAGQIEDDALELYLRRVTEDLDLRGAVRMEGFPEDLSGWLADKHFVVSASIGDGLPPVVLEAMAMGLKPVVHSFPGCDAVLPEEYRFRTLEEFCERVARDPYDPAACRRFVERRFTPASLLTAVLETIADLETPVETPPQPAQTDIRGS